VTRHRRVRGVAEIDNDDREIALRADQRHTDIAPVGFFRFHLCALPSDTATCSPRNASHRHINEFVGMATNLLASLPEVGMLSGPSRFATQCPCATALLQIGWECVCVRPWSGVTYITMTISRNQHTC
jgi:hypothetical protein